MARGGNAEAARSLLRECIRELRSSKWAGPIPPSYATYLADGLERILQSPRTADPFGVGKGRGRPIIAATRTRDRALAAAHELLQRHGCSEKEAKQILEGGFSNKVIRDAIKAFPRVEDPSSYWDERLYDCLTPGVATLIRRILGNGRRK